MAMACEFDFWSMVQILRFSISCPISIWAMRTYLTLEYSLNIEAMKILLIYLYDEVEY